ncbi:hypothetical protein GCM10010307_71240 [Streptomyces vastus]|uniref:Uncharacterized protein n=1 Tax=Streptomyces vastus TaxID=285451 RepID=A0ABP6E478_9ACTN
MPLGLETSAEGADLSPLLVAPVRPWSGPPAGAGFIAQGLELEGTEPVGLPLLVGLADRAEHGVDVLSAELGELDAAEVRDEVVLDVSAVDGGGGTLETGLGLQPAAQVLLHGLVVRDLDAFGGLVEQPDALGLGLCSRLEAATTDTEGVPAWLRDGEVEVPVAVRVLLELRATVAQRADDRCAVVVEDRLARAVDTWPLAGAALVRGDAHGCVEPPSHAKRCRSLTALSARCQGL